MNLMPGEEVLAQWTDFCYRPAKIERVNKGTYMVKFQDGVVRPVKRMHVKSMLEGARVQDWVPMVRAATKSKSTVGASSHGGREDDCQGKPGLGCEGRGFPRKAGESASEEDSERLLEKGDGMRNKREKKGKHGMRSSRKGQHSSKVRALRRADKDGDARVGKRTDAAGISQEPFGAEQDQASVTPKPALLPAEPHGPQEERWLSAAESAPSPGLRDIPRAEKDPLLFATGSEPTLCHSDIPATTPGLALSSKAPSPVTPLPTIVEVAKQTDGPSSNKEADGEKLSLPTAGSDPKSSSRTPQRNKRIREPILKMLQSDLKHCSLLCKVAGCSKAFRKAELLAYHLKYYHGVDRDHDGGSPQAQGNKRQSTISGSAYGSTQAPSSQAGCHRTSMKPPNMAKNKWPLAPVSSKGAQCPPSPSSCHQVFRGLHNHILKKAVEQGKNLDSGLVRQCKKIKLEEQSLLTAREKMRKEKSNPFTIKLKTKKSKQDNLEYPSLALPGRSSSPHSALNLLRSPSPEHQFPQAILSVDLTGEDLSDIDFLEDSDTESLLISSDDLDFPAMEDNEEGKDVTDKVMRCVCEVDEKNSFMIQCEECRCWQHSLCMGLLNEDGPEQYVCHVCRDPPGQRRSARFRHHRDWMLKGHMYGLSFLSENYSHLNASKIVSTHQLLADMFGIKKVLHGLQLKMDLLRDEHSPGLHLCAHSWTAVGQMQPGGTMSLPELLTGVQARGAIRSTYISSEHSYQKPPGSGLGPWGPPTRTVRFLQKEEVEMGGTYRAPLLFPCVLKDVTNSSRRSESRLQVQLSLLTHIEDVQNQVVSRMDQLEKEVDVLESCLDLTGELEPPEPLIRLPQLKGSIKQLLTDLAKVRRMSSMSAV